MKRLMMIAFTVVCAFTFIPSSVDAGAQQVHTVKYGESLYKIAMKHGVSVPQIKGINNKWENLIYPGEQLKLPVTLNTWEKDLLARLIEAEAEGESYAGKVAVATVVLNRVESDLFPNSLYGVIYDGRQFSPVSNGSINQPASMESKHAVEEALRYQGLDQGSLFFYNPNKATSNYLSSKEVTVIIGNHVFLR